MLDQDINKNQTMIYDNPLVSKYASSEMLYIFSPLNKYQTWRKLWLSLAKAQKSVGLNITDAQIQEMANNISNIDFSLVQKYEAETHHEVMAHVKAFAEACPLSAPIIHWGETSAFVIDNADIIIYKDALKLLEVKLYKLISILANFSNQYKQLMTLAFTHLQAAQPTTVGKRATLWLSAFIADFNEITALVATLRLRGVKGATGTAASFKNLLNSYSSLQTIDNAVAQDFGFSTSYGVTSQTYDRKVDLSVANALVQLAVSGHKVTNDLRLLQHFKEISEPFGSKQVGSSAMPYKRNPILSERVSSLAKFIISLGSSPALIASTQWLERTLDDSANKRLTLPQMFLAADSVLELLNKIFTGITVYPQIIQSNLNRELPFLATENILMYHVRNGGNRQEGHEAIRKHAMTTFNEMQVNNGHNRLLELIAADETILLNQAEINKLVDQNVMTGFAEEQVVHYLKEEVYPLIENYKRLNIN